MIHNILILFAAMLLVACASTYGTPITEEQISSVQQGITTEQDLRALFGKPVSTARMSDGKVIISWAYAKVGIGVYTNNTFTATIGADGKLESYIVGETGN